MTLALFDLDNTLLGGDSDHLWGEFLVSRGIVDRTTYETANNRFYQQYREGTLDIDEFLRFSLAVLSRHPLPQLEEWRAQYMEEFIEPIILPKAQALVAKHRAAGDTLIIITATNNFVTAPIAARYGVPHLIATEAEMINGCYSGRVAGTPCFQKGKIVRLEAWLAAHQQSWQESYFYSDSHNDLPLLQRVDHPVVINGDSQLTAFAERAGWPAFSLR
ncbi:MAG: HAD family hydrolase [Gammaproteobacteria bacterium]|nr:HAD family hydrolase [Gammaproteobacteria bacterium]